RLWPGSDDRGRSGPGDGGPVHAARGGRRRHMRDAVLALGGRLMAAASRWLALLAFAAVPAGAFEIEAEQDFGAPGGPQVAVLSTTDIAYFAPVIERYLATRPNLAVHYVVASSNEVHRAIADEGASYDLVISSAMDLQMQLANDGFARAAPPDFAVGLAPWARWRDSLFAVAQEPVVALLSEHALDGGLPAPRTRRDLIELLREHPDRFRGRIGTYDARSSGAGYLFASQDARMSDGFWRLAEIMGQLDARLYCCSADMIADLRAGRLLLAYNVLGSYFGSGGAGAGLTKIELEDYTITLLRTGLVPSSADDPGEGFAFLAYLLSP